MELEGAHTKIPQTPCSCSICHRLYHTLPYPHARRRRDSYIAKSKDKKKDDATMRRFHQCNPTLTTSSPVEEQVNDNDFQNVRKGGMINGCTVELVKMLHMS
jgi:hypothetical protein